MNLSLEVGYWEVGKSRGRKKKNGDAEVETRCWIKLRYIGSYISSRSKVDSSLSGIGTHGVMVLVSRLLDIIIRCFYRKYSFYYWFLHSASASSASTAACQILRVNEKCLLEQGNALDCVDPNMGNYPKDEVLPVLKLALICTSQIPSSMPSMAEVVQILHVISIPVPQRLEGF
ncbi:unnamed protein product [Fraxinus pennsylvanica]|uniref:Uncharacterized protein n=1 Tax=Fraxinus pennsylvanica TaxID=56036 RepID=A0AAD1YMP3_9LAMI|nr:unnamed protein product [Fraxinus pennsylvanica]